MSVEAYRVKFEFFSATTANSIELSLNENAQSWIERKMKFLKKREYLVSTSKANPALQLLQPCIINVGHNLVAQTMQIISSA